MYTYLAKPVGAIVTLVIIIGSIFGLYRWFNPVEPEPVPTIEDRCQFVIKSNNAAIITEHTAGAYNYEVYITPDGYIEIWKCNK